VVNVAHMGNGKCIQVLVRKLELSSMLLYVYIIGSFVQPPAISLPASSLYLQCIASVCIQ
jgi:hypothetical protein